MKKKYTKILDLHTNSISMAIRIYVTGGTFDKEYNKISGQLFFQETHLVKGTGDVNSG